MGNEPAGTVVDEAVDRTLDWAAAMKEWLNEHESHIDALVRERKLPRPPQW